ncbi:MAG TPA: YceI family protein [Hanamia sp.]|nr:YceI family protein [Hanamia sp.]
MKRLLLSTLFLLSGICLWAQVLVGHDGLVSLFGKKPFESIRADNHDVDGTIDTKTGNVEFKALVKSFHFRKKSMEQPFNEKYMESDKYPNASFVGKILNMAAINLNKPGTYPIMVEGYLTIRNVPQWVSHPATLIVTKDELIAKSQFTAKPADYKINVPRVLGRRVVTEIYVAVDMKFSVPAGFSGMRTSN